MLAQLIGGAQGGPPQQAPPSGGGSTESMIREMIQLGRRIIDSEDTDPQEMAVVEQITTMLQKLTASRAAADEKAMGVTPQMKSMRRAYA